MANKANGIFFYITVVGKIPDLQPEYSLLYYPQLPCSLHTDVKSFMEGHTLLFRSPSWPPVPESKFSLETLSLSACQAAQ
jgi:hypothetical protein